MGEKELFIIAFNAGVKNEKIANGELGEGSIMHAESAYEAYLGWKMLNKKCRHQYSSVLLPTNRLHNPRECLKCGEVR